MATTTIAAEPEAAMLSRGPTIRGALRRSGSTVYRWAVDTSSSVTYNTPIGVANEVFLANLSFSQSLHIRGMNAALAMITARPYGMVRDYVFKKLDTHDDSSIIRKAMSNAAASVLFGTPIYAATLFLNGADRKQVICSVAFGILTSPVTSTLSGMYYDKVRRLFGLKPACDIRRGKEKNK